MTVITHAGSRRTVPGSKAHRAPVPVSNQRFRDRGAGVLSPRTHLFFWSLVPRPAGQETVSGP